MGKSRSPNREKAFELYKEYNGKIKPKEIADLLNEKVSNIYIWKNSDEWELKLHGKVGAPKGNDNAVNNIGGRAPKGNLNSIKNGMYCDLSKRLPNEFIKKWFPIGFKNAYNDSAAIGLSKLDKLGHSIDMLWAKILVSQKITAIKNKKDITKELKKESWGKSPSQEYEIQFAWDKENSSLDTYSKALERLSNMIDKYEKLLHANWDLATEEQKTRIEVLKSKINNDSNDKEDKIDSYFKALEGVFKID